MELKITAVEVLAVEGLVPAHPGVRQRQVRPLDRYVDERPSLISPAISEEAMRPGRALYLRLGTSDGPEGLYGPIDEETVWPILRQLAGFVVGKDAMGVGELWDKMERLDRHARHGQLKMAISAIDNAAWDLRARALQVPVWHLLGGSSRTAVPAYASTLGLSHDAGELEEAARRLANEGFGAQKWFFTKGPGDGADGLRTNLALIERLRGELGEHYPLMFDAFMGWDVGFARAWASSARRFAPTWLEEPLAPGALAAYRELRRGVDVPLAAGEHLYDRAEMLEFLSSGVLSVLQADPEWCGGVSELVRICALAALFGVRVIPHGHGLHAALHVVASQSPEVCPMVEYLLNVMPGRFYFERNPPVPHAGEVMLPSAPGFGIELDEEKATSVRHLSASLV